MSQIVAARGLIAFAGATTCDISTVHSNGAQVNAITKSGTNRFAGSVGGYFCTDKWNAEDLVVHRVLSYQDRRVSTTFGGPIIRDRLHFFANYEYERNPRVNAIRS